MRVKFIVISDLHCRDSNEKTKTTYLYSDLLKTPTTQHPVESLKKLIVDKNIRCDYLICLGDITDKINQQGMISGLNYINEIAASLKIGNDKMITIVGNHDIDSRKIHPYPHFNYIVKNLGSVIPINDNTLCDLFWNKNFIIKEFDDLVLFAYNSVYNHTDSENATKTDIDNTTLEKVSNELKRIPANNKPRIAIFHHHPVKYSNFEVQYKDGDSIENGDKLLELLSANNFSIAMHGHKHIPRLEYRNDLPIFCAGSFSSLENLSVFGRRNTFHLIEIDTIATKSTGKIETFEFIYGKGWNMSTDSDGFFPSITGFGYIGDINTLSKDISDWFNKQGRELIDFSKALNQFKELQYLMPFQQKKLEDALNSQYQIKILPSLNSTPIYITKELT